MRAQPSPAPEPQQAMTQAHRVVPPPALLAAARRCCHQRIRSDAAPTKAHGRRTAAVRAAIGPLEPAEAVRRAGAPLAVVAVA